jgi:predicted transcriptional regulator
MNELKITKKTEYTTFTIRVDKNILEFYEKLAGETNRSRNDVIGLALDFSKDKIIIEEIKK